MEAKNDLSHLEWLHRLSAIDYFSIRIEKVKSEQQEIE